MPKLKIELEPPYMLVHAPASEAAIKKDLGGRWDKSRKVWKLPAISMNALRLIEYYGDAALAAAPEDVRALAYETWGAMPPYEEEFWELRTHCSWSRLYEFQREAVEYLYSNSHMTGLIALSPGLGKTAVSTVAMDVLDCGRVLILAPVTLTRTWKDEIEKWGSHPREIKRATASDRSPGSEVTIANHEVLQEVVLQDEDGKVFQPEWVGNAKRVKEWRAEGPKIINEKGKPELVRKRIVRVRRDYLETDWDLIIVDESVLLKNRKAVKTDILHTMRKNHDGYTWLLSGSPTTRYRNDLYRQMQIMMPIAFPSYWRFTEFFCIVDKDGWGWTIEGDRPGVDPQHYLKDFLFVKSQDDVLKELPAYIPRDILVEPGLKQRGALDQMLESWIAELDDGEPVTASNWLTRTTRLAQLTSDLGAVPKVNGDGFYATQSAKTDTLLDLIAADEIEMPLLIWCWFIETANSIERKLNKKFPKLRVGKVTGQQLRLDKEQTITRYKDEKLDALIMQTGVGKFGHTFTDTRTVYYHDRTFDSDAWVQSLRRVRRIGLTHRPVLIIPRIEDSVDDLIDLNMEGKLPSVAELTNSNLKNLLISQTT